MDARFWGWVGQPFIWSPGRDSIHCSLSWIFDLIWVVHGDKMRRAVQALPRSYQRDITTNVGARSLSRALCARVYIMYTHAENASGRGSNASSESYEHNGGESIRFELMRSRRP